MNRVKLCDSCGAAIVYAKQVGKTGPGHKANPIDATPSDDGNLRLYDDACYAIIPAGALAAYHRSGVLLHKSHFATCPQAGKHRRRTKAKA